MPIGDLPGWSQVFVDDFSADVDAGRLDGNRFFSYLGHWSDSSRRGTYDPSWIRVAGGSLRLPVGTVAGARRTSAVVPQVPAAEGPSGGQRYGRFSIRARAKQAPGYKFVALLWPDSEQWPRDGEINFPEADLDGTEVWAFMHRQGATAGSDQDAFRTTATYSDWHTYTIEWEPHRVRFFLDGVLVGVSTERIPDTAMHLVLQAETSLHAATVPASSATEVEVDWVAIWERV